VEHLITGLTPRCDRADPSDWPKITLVQKSAATRKNLL